MLPSVARLQRLVMSQGMVAHSPTGAGVHGQLYPSIGCHGSPMEASCREVWDETTINSTSLAAIAQSLTAETLSSVSMHAQSSGLWTPCHRVLCDGLWLLGSRALRPPRLVLIFHTHPPKACSLITERALSCRTICNAASYHSRFVSHV